MRDDTRRRLERQLMMQRLKWGGALAAVAVALTGVFWLEDRDLAVENRKVAGVVEYVGPLKGKNGVQTLSTSLEVDVKLNDGRLARVVAAKDQSPKIGDKVEIAEHIHGTGRRTFSWH